MKKNSILIIHTSFRKIQHEFVKSIVELSEKRSLYAKVSSLDITSCILFAAPIYNIIYNYVIKKHQTFWSLINYVLNESIINKYFVSLLNYILYFFIKKMKLIGLINNINPNIIIVTSSFSARILSTLKTKNLIPNKIYFFITDYYIHELCIFKNIDLYLIPFEEMKSSLIAKGIFEDKIKIAGLPLSEDFITKKDKIKACREITIRDDIFNIMIYCQTFSIDEIKDILDSIRNIDRPCKPVLFLNSTTKINTDLKLMILNDNSNFEIIKNNINMSLAMDACDAVICRFTDVMLLEAFAKKIPVIIAGIIPRHSKRNFDILSKENLILRADNKKELIENISSIIQTPTYSNEIIEKMHNLSNTKIVDAFCEQLTIG